MSLSKLLSNLRPAKRARETAGDRVARWCSNNVGLSYLTIIWIVYYLFDVGMVSMLFFWLVLDVRSLSGLQLVATSQHVISYGSTYWKMYHCIHMCSDAHAYAPSYPAAVQQYLAPVPLIQFDSVQTAPRDPASGSALRLSAVPDFALWQIQTIDT